MTANARIPLRRIPNRHRLTLALVAAMSAPAVIAQTMPPSTANLPTEGVVRSGTIDTSHTVRGVINPYYSQTPTNTLTITQTSRGGIIDWGAFNIGTGYNVQINNGSGVTLNRVVGFAYGSGGCFNFGGCAATPSNIQGTLSATGSVFLINPAGITFSSTAQINVGSLVASTLAISDGDFNAGVASGSYRFQAAGSDTNGIANWGTISASDGGTLGFLSSWFFNAGSLVAPQGTVAYGSAQQVTLDFFGDGLTQVAISGNGLVDQPAVGCEFFCNDTPSQFTNAGSIVADGGNIIARTTTTTGAAGDPAVVGGLIMNSGLLQANRIGMRNGQIVLDAGAGTITQYTARPGDGIRVDGQTKAIGGRIEMRAHDIVIESSPSQFEPVPVSSVDVGDGRIDMVAANSVTTTGNTALRADAAGNAGTITIGAANSVQLDGLVSASSSGGTGGTIDVTAGDYLGIGGSVLATGATGGTITTTTLSGFSIGGAVNAGGSATPGLWTLNAPYINVIPSLFSTTGSPNAVVDDTINYALAGGSNVTLNATSGDVNFATGVDVSRTRGTLPLVFRTDATGDITGNDFRIGSTAGPLSVALSGQSINLGTWTLLTAGGYFSATASAGGLMLSGSNVDTAGGAILLSGTQSGSGTGVNVGGTFTSGAGDITIIGNTPSGTGVLLSGSLATATGNVSVTGTSGSGVGLRSPSGKITTAGGSIALTGSGSTAGVHLQETQTNSGGGAITVNGTANATGGVGVWLDGSRLNGGAGNVTVTGSDPVGDGIRLTTLKTGIMGGATTTSGAITFNGTGASYGIDLGTNPGAIQTQSGDTHLIGHAVGAAAVAGVRLGAGDLTTAGGDVTVEGISAAGTGVLMGDAGSFSIGSGGGAIAITGTGVASGVDLRNGTVNSSGGSLAVSGTASAAGGSGVSLDATTLDAGAGNLTVSGSNPAGAGIVLLNNAQAITTTGNITFNGTGASYGIDLGTNPGAIQTQSGDIHLIGHAVGAAAVAGVRVGAGGLRTTGGDIVIDGTTTNGTGALVAGNLDSGGGAIAITGQSASGDGVAFSGALTSRGGSISINGSSSNGRGILGAAGSIDSAGGSIALTGSGSTAGVHLQETQTNSGGGAITVNGTASATGGVGVWLDGSRLNGGAGNVTVTGSDPAGDGIRLTTLKTGIMGGATTTSGAITFNGTGASYGIDLGTNPGAIQTQSGNITLIGHAVGAAAVAGVRLGAGDLTTAGGDVTVEGTSAAGIGVLMGDAGSFSIGSGGGAIAITGTGVASGVDLRNGTVDSGGGRIGITGNGSANGVSLTATQVASAGGRIDVTGTATGAGGIGVAMTGAGLSGGSGNVAVIGRDDAGNGVRLQRGSSVITTSGAITLSGFGAASGMTITDGVVQTQTGHVDLRGRSTAGSNIGLDTRNTTIRTAAGGVSLAGESVGGTGAAIGAVDAGNSLVVIRAGNAGGSDAIALTDTITSGVGVNLRPGGVDANGGLTERSGDAILLGGNGNGFAVSAAELARIGSPELVIGSPTHSGSITVNGAVMRAGNLTLQNQGGSGGIALQAGVDVGDGTLVLASGGTIAQTADGAIRAHSLLAQAGGDVLLASAANNVASNTLAGSAGGTFRYQDVDALSIGSVSGRAIDAAGAALTTLSTSGISAGGDVFVRNLAGDLTLRSGVSGNNIDLVTAGRLQNLGNATLDARDDWRVWASTWEGETRGGLAGSGDLPNLYGCTYGGACVVTVPTDNDHFIYVQQPVATVTFGNATREYGLPNPVLDFTVTGAILGDGPANVATGSATTTATQASDVGNYPVSGSFSSRAGYIIRLVPGVFTITPATLLFTANPAVRYLGTANPPFSGTVTGFRNSDTVTSVFGSGVIWSSPAGLLSPIGFHPINGGTSAKNYVFSQAPGNATALQIIPLPAQFIPTTTGASGVGGLYGGRDDLIVYSGGDGGPAGHAVRGAPMCALNAPLGEDGLPTSGDPLSREWTKVRSRPNLTNCFDSERKNSCGDF